MKQKLSCNFNGCPIILLEEDGAIIRVLFDENEESRNVKEEISPLLQEAQKQLGEYFSGIRRAFNLPLRFHGTAFQERVWRTLMTIPYGQTWSYRQLAEAVGSPRGFRAVGMANNRNPLPVLIPCHRVVGSNGSVVGYGGGLEIKKILLGLEAEGVSHLFG